MVIIIPNRILKDSIRTSDTIDELTWFEEVFFYRLIVTCDDYGRFDARPKILKAELFPLKDGVTLKQIVDALNKLSTVGLVQVYEYDQKPYLQLTTWARHQQIRNQKSKYPEPPAKSDFNCNQLLSNAPVIQSNPIRIQSESESKESKRASAQPDLSGFSPSMQAKINEWLNYKKERKEAYTPTGLKSMLSQIKSKVEQYGEAPVCYLIDLSMANNWKGIIWGRINEAKNSAPRRYEEPDFLSGG